MFVSEFANGYLFDVIWRTFTLPRLTAFSEELHCYETIKVERTSISFQNLFTRDFGQVFM
jgi:hypothetical protein